MKTFSRRKATLILLEVIFIASTFLIAYLHHATVPPFHLLLLVLAAYRVGRAIAYDDIFSWLRAPLEKYLNDEGDGFWNAIADLIFCPICAGTWSGLALFILYLFAGWFGFTLIELLAVAGGLDFLNDIGNKRRF